MGKPSLTKVVEEFPAITMINSSWKDPPQQCAEKGFFITAFHGHMNNPLPTPQKPSIKTYPLCTTSCHTLLRQSRWTRATELRWALGDMVNEHFCIKTTSWPRLQETPKFFMMYYSRGGFKWSKIVKRSTYCGTVLSMTLKYQCLPVFLTCTWTFPFYVMNCL